MGVLQNLRNTFRGVPEITDTRTLVNEYTGSTTISTWLDGGSFTRDKALAIPVVKASIGLIKNTVREIPVKLYKKEQGGRVTEVTDDKRTFLLNCEPGDTLNASQMWDAMIEDYFLDGSAYVYINKKRNVIQSLHYVKSSNIAVAQNQQPIFKDYYIQVMGNKYDPYQFLKIIRDTRDGAKGTGIVAEQELLLRTIYNSLKFENNLVETGGNKKGFLKSENRLTAEAIAQLKESWRNLYSSNTENVVVLNKGLDFQESSNSAVEMQLTSQKELNDAEVAKLFAIPLGMISGTGSSGASEDDKHKFFDYCILPFLRTLENAMNRDLLLESEKGTYFFRFDTKDIQKGSLLERMQAYEIAKRNNFMLLDEIRRNENLPDTNFKYMDLGLSSVLYDPEKGKLLVTNTGSVFDLEETLTNGVNNNDTDKNNE